MRVLIVEDDLDLQDAQFRALREAGHSVIATSSVEHALLAIANEPIDCVVLDYHLPGLVGQTFLDTVNNESFPLSGRPAIIICTTDPGAFNLSHYPERIAISKKPLDLGHLLETVERLGAVAS